MIRLIVQGSSGRMGQVIAGAVERTDDCEIVAGIDSQGATGEESFPVFRSFAECRLEADVVIDFSSPESAGALAEVLTDRKIPAVVATTGLPAETENRLMEASKHVALLRAANMSVGVNLVKSLIFKTAMVLGPAFDVEIVERHHNLKKDAPSGTAKVLAEAVNKARDGSMNFIYGRQGFVGERKKNELGIHAVRAGTIVGEHDVLFAGKDEAVQVSHKAYSRQVFAEGALAAARYIAGKPAGYYTMDDLVAEQTVVTNIYTTVDEALVEITDVPSNMDNLAMVFDLFASEQINVDMISQGLGASDTWDLSFTVQCAMAERVESLIEDINNRLKGVSARVEKDIAKVTVEGLGMETQSGVACRVFKSMADAGITIKAITTSETKIALVVDEARLGDTVGVIKREFDLP